MTLEAIKEAIEELPSTEKTSLVAWLNAQDNIAWDAQIEADFSQREAGIKILQEWDAEIDGGKSIGLEEFLEKGEKSFPNRSPR